MLCVICVAFRYKLLGGLAVRRACYGVLRYIMEEGAKGAEVIVSGKLRAQRAKSMKFADGYMIKSGNAKRGKCHMRSRRDTFSHSCTCMPYWLLVACPYPWFALSR